MPQNKAEQQTKSINSTPRRYAFFSADTVDFEEILAAMPLEQRRSLVINELKKMLDSHVEAYRPGLRLNSR